MTTAVQSQPRRWTLARILSVGFVLLVGLSLLGLLAWGMTVAGKPSGNIAIKVKPAQQFALNLYDGKKVALADLRGKTVVVNFWASWCVPCKEEAAVLEAAAKQYADKGVVFLGVNIWDNDADARQFLTDYKITYPNGVDPKGEIAIDYGVSGIPESYFIDKNGQLVRKFVGPLNPQQIRVFLEDLAK